MDERIDEFARLQRLRAQGVLTETEYQRQKSALMGHHEPPISSAPKSWFAARGRRTISWAAIACFAFIGVVSSYYFGKAAALGDTRKELGVPEVAATAEGPEEVADERSDWVTSQSTDPMSDVSVAQALITLAGNEYDAEVSVACGSDGNITYSATSFDKDGEPAEMRSRSIPFGMLAGTWIDYQMRADGHPAKSLSTRNPAYSNQIQLKTGKVGPLYENGSGIDDAEVMASASRVVLRLLMTSGEETYELPQAQAAFKSVVAPCLASRQGERQQLTAAKQEEEAGNVARKHALIDRLYDDAAVDADTLIWMANNRQVPVDQPRLAEKRQREAGKPRPSESPNINITTGM